MYSKYYSTSVVLERKSGLKNIQLFNLISHKAKPLDCPYTTFVAISAFPVEAVPGGGY